MAIYPLFFAIFSLGFFAGAMLFSIITITLSRQAQTKSQTTETLEITAIKHNLNYLPSNQHLIDWYMAPVATNPSRQLNRALPELVPGPLLLPLRTHETLLFADEIGQAFHQEPELLPQMPLAPQTRAS